MSRSINAICSVLSAVIALAAATAQAGTSLRVADPTPGIDQYFGAALATSDRWMLVGVPDDVVMGGNKTGSVVVFELIDGRYVEHSRLLASDGANNDAFGIAVAVDGGTAVVGAWNDSLPAGSGAGSVYVYTFDGLAWTPGPKITAPDAATGDGFGRAVSLDGDVLLVGAPFDDLTSLANAGSAHVFVRNGAWTHAAKLVAADAMAFDLFGHATEVSDADLLVGAPAADAGAGAVYAFERSGAVIDFVHRFVPADRGLTDLFGAALSIEGNTVLVGAAHHANQAGAAYVFRRAANTWAQQQKLVSPATAPGDRSGQSVSLRDGVALLGSPLATVGACCQQGAVDLFISIGNRWQFERRLRAADGEPFDQLGSAVALSDAGAVSGAPLSQDRGSGVRDAGSVLHFFPDWPFFVDGFETRP